MVIIAAAIAFAAGFGVGYWVKNRGVAGIESDLKDAREQVAALTDKVKGVA